MTVWTQVYLEVPHKPFEMRYYWDTISMPRWSRLCSVMWYNVIIIPFLKSFKTVREAPFPSGSEQQKQGWQPSSKKPNNYFIYNKGCRAFKSKPNKKLNQSNIAVLLYIMCMGATVTNVLEQTQCPTGNCLLLGPPPPPQTVEAQVSLIPMWHVFCNPAVCRLSWLCWPPIFYSRWLNRCWSFPWLGSCG